MKTPMFLLCITATLVTLGLTQPAQGSAGTPLLSLNSTYDPPSNTVTVTVDVSGLGGQLIVGGQFFLEYDEMVLDFMGMEFGGAPWVVEIFEDVDQGLGTIDYAVGIDPEVTPEGSSADDTMAIITFNRIGELCDVASLVFWRAHDPPSGITDDLGTVLTVFLVDLLAIIGEGDSCNDKACNEGETCTAGVCAGGSATDCSGTAPDACNLDFTCDSGGAEGNCDTPGGTTNEGGACDDAVNCTLNDECLAGTCVGVAQDTVDVTVELQAIVEAAPFDRCITFKVWDCPGPAVEVSVVMTFSGGVATASIPVTCNENYTCITAKDELHTLGRTVSLLPVLGKQYEADFVFSDGADLVGGNLNNDCFIDIFDFGTFIGQFGDAVGADTDCSTTAPHSDISGDGTVFTADFTFIGINFLESDDANCCVAGCPISAPGGGAGGPVTRISVKELRKLGLYDMIAADLNEDGWFDEEDIGAFMNGDRPSPARAIRP
ncbi:MAG: cohesin domain-containing protein [Planctomycetota bacterium]|nr:cohesin domain-containing protein [Planctomycetota bacterium]